MKLKQLIAKAMVVGGLGLPTVGLGTGMADAQPPCSPPPGPPPPNVTAMANCNKVVPETKATPFTFTSIGTLAAQAGPATAAGVASVPTVAATPFGGEAPRSSNTAGLNRRGWVAHDLRLSPPFGPLLLGPAGLSLG